MDIEQLIGIAIVFGLLWVTVYYQLSIRVWTILIGAGLLVLSIFGFLPHSFASLAWIIFLVAAAFANSRGYRLKYLMPVIYHTMQKKMPAISATEREAIEAGNTWWEKELFCGDPNWQGLLRMPKPVLSAAEQSFLDNQVEQLCAMLDDWQIVHDRHNLPDEVWSFLKREKFFGMIIPEEYGGLGFSAIAHSTVIVKIASRSISAAVDTMVPNTLGPAELLLHYGTEEQKSYYLPRLAVGDEIPCFALTAPDAGSDASAIQDTGIVCRGEFEGRETLGIRVSWDKRYITLAPIATVLGLAFHLYDPDHLLGDEEDLGITLCLIPTSHPGVEIGTRHLPLLLAFMNGPTRGNDVFIPMDWIIGGPEMAGQGWRMLMESLSAGRSISLPALATACGKIAYRYTGAYARLRRQFNVPISSFEGIGEALGYIAGYTYLLESCRNLTASAVDMGVKPAIASAMAKYHMTELSRQVVTHAMDIHAGHMIQVGPRNFLAYVHVAMPISITVEGANILTRNLIIFGQGAIRCHPYLLKEIALITSPEIDLEELDKVLLSHMGYYIRNMIKAVGFGLTGGLFISSPIKNKRIRKYQKQLTRMSTALALAADTAVIMLGGGLKRRERISARLGDILSQLYLASAVLKYYQDNGKQDDEVDYVCWCLQLCLRRIQIAMEELFDNFPKRIAGTVLKWMVFPFGRAYKAPADKLHERIVSPMLSVSTVRDRLTRYAYISQEETELGCRLETALDIIADIDPIQKKLQMAVREGKISKRLNADQRIQQAQDSGILTPEEAECLSEFDKLRNEIIKVNEFSFDLSQIVA